MRKTIGFKMRDMWYNLGEKIQETISDLLIKSLSCHDSLLILILPLLLLQVLTK